MTRQMQADKNHTAGRLLLIVGSAGFAVVFLLNLLGWFVLDEPAAEFFSARWWSEWFPEYAVWPIFMAIGAVFIWTRRKKQSRVLLEKKRMDANA